MSGEGISISVTEIKKGSAVAVTTGTVIVDAKDLTSVSPLQLVVSDPDNFVALSVFDQELMSALELTRPLGVSVVRSTYGYGEVGYAGYKFTFTTLQQFLDEPKLNFSGTSSLSGTNSSVEILSIKNGTNGNVQTLRVSGAGNTGDPSGEFFLEFGGVESENIDVSALIATPTLLATKMKTTQERIGRV